MTLPNPRLRRARGADPPECRLSRGVEGGAGGDQNKLANGFLKLPSRVAMFLKVNSMICGRGLMDEVATVCDAEYGTSNASSRSSITNARSDHPHLASS